MSPFADPLVQAGVAGLPALLRSGQTTAEAVCSAYLARARHATALGAYVWIDEDAALAQARASAQRWRRGAALSAIDGCPVAIKANIAVEGWPWHAGIGAFRERRASADAASVSRLREAGAVLLGLTNMDEGAFGAATDNAVFGHTDNPWKTGHTPGGSSGGAAAAVAVGLCAAALATDTLGSVRIPAGLCGVYGYKPGRAVISLQGVVPLAPTLDHVGVLARTADDCRIIAQAAAGAVIGAAIGSSLLQDKPLAALAPEAFGVIDPGVSAAFEASLAGARAKGFSIHRLDLDPEWVKTLLRAAVLVVAAEGLAHYEPAMATEPRGFSEVFQARLGLAARKGAGAVADAYAVLEKAVPQAEAMLEPFSAVLTPTTPRPAPPRLDPMHDAGVLTTLANILHRPAIACPIGFDDAGLPQSLQLMAADEATALALAADLGQPCFAPPGWR